MCKEDQIIKKADGSEHILKCDLNIAIHETEPYQALAKEIVGTCLDENLEPAEVIKAIKEAFLHAAQTNAFEIEAQIQRWQSDAKKTDMLIQAIKKA